jgi:hypothetical protein
MTLKEKLATIQANLNVQKSQWNDFGKYNYRSCEDILEGVKPLLKETKTIRNLGIKLQTNYKIHLMILIIIMFLIIKCINKIILLKNYVV